MNPILWTPWRMPYLTGEEKKDYEGCVFCAKSSADDDASEYVVVRSEHVFVALNSYPYNNGHLLIVPYAHVASVEDLPPDVLTDLMQTLNKALAALRRIYNPDAFNIGANIGSAAGAGIPAHFHLHVVPRWQADVGFITVVSGTRVVPDTLDTTYRRLREAWDE
ncbi:MAG: HIT domain-containing protein [Anaerolineae bacterium]|jgi:ATP adenylyltransferase|nr:HIT domain-containing protein [Anaerolineae bacterium]